MLPIEIISTFFLASIFLAIAPGPDNIFVLTQSALHGKCSGLAVMTGLCTGLLFHTGAVAMGVAVILKTSVVAFSLLKFAGAGYMLYLAWGILRHNPQKISLQENQVINLGKLYRRGIFMNVTNPKVSIFFLAFLPQFAEPQRGSISLQIIALGGIFILATVLVFGTVALIGGALGHWLNRSARAQKIMNLIAGAIFVGLACKLIAAEH